MQPVHMFTPLHIVTCVPQAYHLGLHYPSHLLLTYAWYAPNWWKDEDQSFSCTVQQRESVLNRSLTFLQYDFLQDRNLTTDTGIVSSRIFVWLYSRLHTVLIYNMIR